MPRIRRQLLTAFAGFFQFINADITPNTWEDIWRAMRLHVSYGGPATGWPFSRVELVPPLFVDNIDNLLTRSSTRASDGAHVVSHPVAPAVLARVRTLQEQLRTDLAQVIHEQGTIEKNLMDKMRRVHLAVSFSRSAGAAGPPALSLTTEDLQPWLYFCVGLLWTGGLLTRLRQCTQCSNYFLVLKEGSGLFCSPRCTQSATGAERQRRYLARKRTKAHQAKRRRLRGPAQAS